MSGAGAESLARWVNLLLPGGGLILSGRVAAGLTICLLFAVWANLAIGMNLLFADDFPGWLRGLTIGLAGGSYLGAQLRLAQALRAGRQQAASARRRQALAAARQYLASGDHARAWEAIRPVAAQAEQDLLVALRVAQVLTARRDVPAALAAWQQVRKLDRHRIYRDQIRAQECRLHALRQATLLPDAPGQTRGA